MMEMQKYHRQGINKGLWIAGLQRQINLKMLCFHEAHR
jgi:hypothetical protein